MDLSARHSLLTYFFILLSGCAGEITNMGPNGTSDAGHDEFDAQPPPGTKEGCYGDDHSSAFDDCTTSSDCRTPEVCVLGQCVATMDEDVYCNSQESGSCTDSTQICAAGLCTTLPEACETNADCPTTYTCDSTDEGRQCVLANTEIDECLDTGGGPNLVGTWTMTSRLAFIEGIDGIAEELLKVFRKASDLINGEWDTDNKFGQILALFIGDAIQHYVDDWALDLVQQVGDVADVLSDVVIDSSLEVEGTGCLGTYQARQSFETIHVTLRNVKKSIPAESLPHWIRISPERFFSLRYHCGRMYLDAHQIGNSLRGLAKIVLNWITEEVSDFESFEDAMTALVQCKDVASAFKDFYQRNCSSVPVPYSCSGYVVGKAEDAAESLCEGLAGAAAAVLMNKIDEEVSEEATMNLQGLATSVREESVSGGIWYGSLENDNFPGTFEMTNGDPSTP